MEIIAYDCEQDVAVVLGPHGQELTETSVAGPDFESVEIVDTSVRGRKFGIAVSCSDGDEDARVFVSMLGEADREVVLWVIEYCSRILKQTGE
jgi:hypothetical protein